APLRPGSIWKLPLILLIGVALYLGNSAYEGGNLSGAALGISAVAGESELVFTGSVISISLLAGLLIWKGSYRHIERTLIGLVLMMALAFAATFVIVRPDFAALLRGMVVPVIPDGALMTVVALIGTTVVPYNLFLHASAVKRRWSGADALPEARADTTIAITVGGLIAILIVSTAAASLFAAGVSVSSAGDMAAQFEPLFGSYSRYLLGLGLFAAGLSSAITAPLATGYVMSEVLGLGDGDNSRAHHLIALSVIAIGAALSLTGIRPITIIISAQFANGLLLPIVATFLLVIMNRREVLGRHANGLAANLLGAIVVLIAAGLGLRSILTAAGVL
ncbi:MAG TPA: manganese transporter, partial [Erythrobacter sp.]|nr:manganese transporter [Erythrobacter sp.]